MDTQAIEVRISPNEILKWPAQGFEMMALDRCKKAGMPLRGTFSFRGVERGTLQRSDDWQTRDIVFKWYP